MPADDESALALADHLRSRSDAELVALVHDREVAITGIRDVFDLADALLTPDAVGVAVSRLSRPSLVAMRAVDESGVTTMADAVALAARAGAVIGDEAFDRPLQLALLLRRADSLAVPQPVAAQLAHVPSLAELATTPAPAVLTPVGERRDGVDRAGTETAYATTTAVAAALTELDREPAHGLARGGIALPDSRRIAAVTGASIDHVGELLQVATRAGLVTTAGDRVVTDAGRAWLALPSARRWALLAHAWLQAVPADVRGILADRAHAEWGDRLRDYLQWLYPVAGDWMRARVNATVRDAELLGITSGSSPTAAGSALVVDGVDAAVEATDFPGEVDRVYVQHDATVVSPGPLAPGVASVLREIADPEGEVAGSWRITPASLQRALLGGRDAASITAFLSEVSLTGIPQPLRYAISEADARLGLVRVRAEGAGSVIRSPDAALLRTIAVDQSLAVLALTESDGVLRSRVHAETALRALEQARYPVGLEDAEGSLRPPAPTRPAPVTAPPPRADPVRALVERLRLAGPGDREAIDRAWLSRQLDAAIRSRGALLVTVAMPDGSTAQYELEPASVAGGRLRARDRRTDLERTLPLRSVTAVHSLDR